MIRTPRIDQLFLVGFIIKVVHQAYGHPEKFFLVHTRPKHGLSWISESRGHPTDNQSAVAAAVHVLNLVWCALKVETTIPAKWPSRA